MRMIMKVFAFCIMLVWFMTATPDTASADTMELSTAERTPEYEAYTLLKQETGLKLDGYWADYTMKNPNQGFASFVHDEYRYYRKVGISMFGGGMAVGVVGFMMFFFGALQGMDCVLEGSDCDSSNANAVTKVGGSLMVAGTLTWIAGATVWGVFDSRLWKLAPYLEEDGKAKLTLQLIGAGPDFGADGRTPGFKIAFVF